MVCLPAQHQQDDIITCLGTQAPCLGRCSFPLPSFLPSGNLEETRRQAGTNKASSNLAYLAYLALEPFLLPSFHSSFKA